MYPYQRDRAQMIGYSKNLTPFIVYHAVITPIGGNDHFKEAFTAYEYTGPEKPNREVSAAVIARKKGNQRQYNKEFCYNIYYIDPTESELDREKAAKEHILEAMIADYKRNFYSGLAPMNSFPFVEGEDYILELHREEIKLDLELPI